MSTDEEEVDTVARRNVALSVVVPAFNAEDTLGEQLRALAGQDAAFSWEVLVCDNGSTDGTAALVRRWQDRMANLRLIDASARRGPSAARNIGVRAARGPLVVFCDADDVVGGGWLAAMHAALCDADFISGGWEGERLNGGNRASVSWTTQTLITEPYLPQLLATASNNMGIRKPVFEEVGGFEEALATCEDIDLSWRVQLAGYPLEHHPEAVLHVRKREGLRAIFRQAYSYGVGDKRLRHRYAPVIAALGPGAPPAIKSLAVSRDTVSAPVQRALAKVRSARGPGVLADRTWRIGQWLGQRLGKVDPSMSQISLPSGYVR